MLSKYFEIKTETEDFKNNIENIFKELNNKKVIIYGAGDGFVELNKQYNFKERLNIVAVADKKFEGTDNNTFCGFKTVAPSEINNTDYDVILLTNENTKRIIYYLDGELNVPKNKIQTIFCEKFYEENMNINLLEYFEFSKQIKKLTKKLRNKRIVIYGAGAFFQAINYYYDISGLNIIALADKKFENNQEEFEGYKTVSPDKIKELMPDVVLVATREYMSIIEDLYFGLLNKTKIDIKPMFKKPFIQLLKEIWKL